MKKILSLLLALTLIFALVACSNEKDTTSEPGTSTTQTGSTDNTETTNKEDDEATANENGILLNFSDTSSLVSEYNGTLFVVNPDKTVSVVGENNGNCEVRDWEDIEKIFACPDATYGIKTDGTCLISKNYTTSTMPKYNKAKKITEHYVLFEDGTLITKDNLTLNEDLPKCRDIIEYGNSFIAFTVDGKLQYFFFWVEGESAEIIKNNQHGYHYVEYINTQSEKIHNIKQIRGGRTDSGLVIAAVQNDGRVYTFGLGRRYEGYFEYFNEIEKTSHWNNINSCVYVNGTFIGITNENKIVAIGNEFSELGGETPQLLTVDNILNIYSLHGTHDGKFFDYAIVICEDGSVFAHKERGTFPKNISGGFLKWKSFEIL